MVLSNVNVMKTIEVAGLRLNIRYLKSRDLGQLVALTSSVRWELTFDDVKLLHKVYPEAFLGAFLDDDTLISLLALDKFNATQVYLGIFLTSSPYQGRGIGRHLFDYAKELSKGNAILLHSVSEKPDFYKKLGFKYRNVDVLHITGHVDRSSLGRGKNPDVDIEMVTDANIDAVIRFDRELTSVNRERLLREWLLSENSQSRCFLAENGDIDGYVVIRPDHVTASPHCYKIVGFYAKNVTVALELLRAALNDLPDKSRVWAEHPNTNENATDVYKTFGLNTLQYELKAMIYNGTLPSLDWTKIYAVTTSFITFF